MRNWLEGNENLEIFKSRWEGGDFARSITLFINYEFWLLCQPEVSVPLTYNGRNCGFCDKLKTAGYFLMKRHKWIDGKVEIMHVFKHFVNPTKTLVAMAT